MQINSTTLKQAASRFKSRRDAFALSKVQVCLDLANTLDRFGSFKSAKQEQYALGLINHSQLALSIERDSISLPHVFALTKAQKQIAFDGYKLILFGSGVVRVVTTKTGFKVCGLIDVAGNLSGYEDCPEHIISALQKIEASEVAIERSSRSNETPSPAPLKNTLSELAKQASMEADLLKSLVGRNPLSFRLN